MNKISFVFAMVSPFCFSGLAHATVPNLADFTSNRDITISADQGLLVNQNRSSYNLDSKEGYGSVTIAKQYGLVLEGKPRSPTGIIEFSNGNFGSDINAIELKNAEEMQSWTKCRDLIQINEPNKRTRMSSMRDSNGCVTVTAAFCERMAKKISNPVKFFNDLQNCAAKNQLASSILLDDKLNSTVENDEFKKSNKANYARVKKVIHATYGANVNFDEEDYAPNINLGIRALNNARNLNSQVIDLLQMCYQSRKFWKKTTSEAGANWGSEVKTKKAN